MLAPINMARTFLLCCILQSGSCATQNGKTLSVGQNIGKLSDIVVYEKNLNPSLRDGVFAILKDSLWYQRFLKRVGADPKATPEALAVDQKKAWNRVYLLFIDLYRIVYTTFGDVIMQYNNSREPEEAFIDPCISSLELMQVMFLEAPDQVAEQASPGVPRTPADKQVFNRINRHYLIPLKRYMDGGDLETLEKSVDRGRVATFQAFVALSKEAIEEN